MGVQDIVAAIPTQVSGGLPDGDALRTELIQGLVGFIPENTAISGGVLQVDPVDAALGGVRQAYVYGTDAGIFVYDSADGTTAQDLIFCLVLIGGKRYKRVGTPARYSLTSRTVTTPPNPDDSPDEPRNYGDAYLNDGFAAWTAEGIAVNSVGIWSSLGGGSWQEIEPDYGPPVYIEDEDSYIHWAGADGWIDGTGNRSFADKTIPFKALIWDGRVENQTTASPPATWSKGVAYIASPSAVSPWTGGRLYIADTDGVLADGDSFTEITPWDGIEAYDKNLKVPVRYSSSATAWQSAAGSYVGRATSVSTSSGSTTAPTGSTLYSYSATVAPTTSQRRLIDTAALSYAAKRSGAALIVKYCCDFVFSKTVNIVITASDPCIALFRDGESDAVDWKRLPLAKEVMNIDPYAVGSGETNSLASMTQSIEVSFEIAAGDTDSHDYTIAILSFARTTSGNVVDAGTLTRRRLALDEAA